MLETLQNNEKIKQFGSKQNFLKDTKLQSSLKK